MNNRISILRQKLFLYKHELYKHTQAGKAYAKHNRSPRFN